MSRSGSTSTSASSASSAIGRSTDESAVISTPHIQRDSEIIGGLSRASTFSYRPIEPDVESDDEQPDRLPDRPTTIITKEASFMSDSTIDAAHNVNSSRSTVTTPRDDDYLIPRLRVSTTYLRHVAMPIQEAPSSIVPQSDSDALDTLELFCRGSQSNSTSGLSKYTFGSLESAELQEATIAHLEIVTASSMRIPQYTEPPSDAILRDVFPIPTQSVARSYSIEAVAPPLPPHLSLNAMAQLARRSTDSQRPDRLRVAEKTTCQAVSNPSPMPPKRKHFSTPPEVNTQAPPERQNSLSRLWRRLSTRRKAAASTSDLPLQIRTEIVPPLPHGSILMSSMDAYLSIGAIPEIPPASPESTSIEVTRTPPRRSTFDGSASNLSLHSHIGGLARGAAQVGRSMQVSPSPAVAAGRRTRSHSIPARTISLPRSPLAPLQPNVPAMKEAAASNIPDRRKLRVRIAANDLIASDETKRKRKYRQTLFEIEDDAIFQQVLSDLATLDGTHLERPPAGARESRQWASSW